MAISTDPVLLDAASDVAVRFRGHGSYGDEEGAIRALRRRVPGFGEETYREVLGFFCSVYDRAVVAIPRHLRERPEKTSRFAEYEEIDLAGCLEELEEIEPGVAVGQKGQILKWCIFWHYLK